MPEILAYGAENEIIDPDNFAHSEDNDHSIFGKKILEVKSIRIMDVWAVAEYVPNSWND